jgi:hypothetical protein
MALATYTSLGFLLINNTTQPGRYAFCLPTLPATGDATTFTFTGTGLRPATVRIALTAGDPRAASLTEQQIANEVQTRTIAAVTVVNGLAANTVTASALATDAVAEIQSGLATPTNITAGTITTATNVTNVNGIAANVITASALATDAVAEIQSGLATPTNITAGTITTATNVTNVNGLAANVITATAIAANAITAAKIATDAIGAAQLAAGAVTEIVNAVVEAEIDALETYNRTTNTAATITGPTSGVTTLTITTDAAYLPIKSIS